MQTSYVAIGIIIAAAVIGGAAYVMMGAPAPVPEKTFYVVAYHWGFAAFDENGAELNQISVDKGTKVTLYAVNEGAENAMPMLPEAVRAAVQAINFHHRAEEDNLVPVPEGQTMENMIEQAHEGGLADHGLGITEFGVNVETDHHAHELSKVTFTADKTGEFDLVCTKACGDGHAYMVMRKLVVT